MVIPTAGQRSGMALYCNSSNSLTRSSNEPQAAAWPADDARQHARARRGLTIIANDDHIALLKQGPKAWNAWRDGNHNIRPDLSEANLVEADLRGVNLSGANLNGAYLSAANLSKADLSKAHLETANRFQANLSGANLSKAKLTRMSGLQVNFSGAKLPGATLDEAFFIQANLADADLSKTNPGSTCDRTGKRSRGCRTIGKPGESLAATACTTAPGLTRPSAIRQSIHAAFAPSLLCLSAFHAASSMPVVKQRVWMNSPPLVRYTLELIITYLIDPSFARRRAG
jgi:Pentapeptide repeats (8 copies)